MHTYTFGTFYTFRGAESAEGVQSVCKVSSRGLGLISHTPGTYISAGCCMSLFSFPLFCLALILKRERR